MQSWLTSGTGYTRRRQRTLTIFIWAMMTTRAYIQAFTNYRGGYGTPRLLFGRARLGHTRVKHRAVILPQHVARRYAGSNSQGEEALESIRDEVEDALLHRCGVSAGSKVLVSVSGGSDSMALLHVLYDIHQRWEPPLRLEVVHFNHGLRPEAIEEEALVQEAAQSLGVPVHVCHWSEGAGDSKGIQSRARAWRRANSEAILAAGGAQVEAGAKGSIATAHHGDDQVETFTLKLLRGAHLSHLRGMDYRQGLYIKPLLGLTKDSLAQYLETKGVKWLEDASNAEDKYRRNKVRLRLLPLMQDIAGGEEALRTRVEELSRQSRGLDAWLEQECERWEGKYTGTQAGLRADEMPLPPWRPLPQMLQEELLHRFVVRVGGLSLAYGQVERLREQLHKGEAQWQVYVGHGWAADCQGDVLRLMRLEGEEGPGVKQDAGDLTLVYPQGWSVRAERLTAQGHGETGKMPWPVVLHNVPQGARLELRTRREGDRFWPAWRSSAIKMKDFLRGQKLPLHRRDSVPLAVMGDQQVVCVYPSHVSAAHATQKMDVAPVGLWIETDVDHGAS